MATQTSMAPFLICDRRNGSPWLPDRILAAQCRIETSLEPGCPVGVLDTPEFNSRGDPMRKLMLGGLLATTLLVPAFAEEWRASKLIGLNVYNDQNEKLGDISEILMDKSGKIDGVVIGVGGFLGVGRHDIKVEMSKLKFCDE